MVRAVKTKTKRTSSGLRRPQCAFFYYAADRRASLREEQPGLRPMDLGRVMGDEWNRLTEEEKEELQVSEETSNLE